MDIARYGLEGVVVRSLQVSPTHWGHHVQITKLSGRNNRERIGKIEYLEGRLEPIAPEDPFEAEVFNYIQGEMK